MSSMKYTWMGTDHLIPNFRRSNFKIPMVDLTAFAGMPEGIYLRYARIIERGQNARRSRSNDGIEASAYRPYEAREESHEH
jgi:hypothetical protein